MEKMAVVQVVHHAPGIIQGCKKCRQVLTNGSFALGLTIGEGDRAIKYLIGESPPRTCCGEEKIFILTFVSETDADVGKRLIEAFLERTHSTEGIPLIAWTIPENN